MAAKCFFKTLEVYYHIFGRIANSAWQLALQCYDDDVDVSFVHDLLREANYLVHGLVKQELSRLCLLIISAWLG